MHESMINLIYSKVTRIKDFFRFELKLICTLHNMYNLKISELEGGGRLGDHVGGVAQRPGGLLLSLGGDHLRSG